MTERLSDAEIYALTEKRIAAISGQPRQWRHLWRLKQLLHEIRSRGGAPDGK